MWFVDLRSQNLAPAVYIALMSVHAETLGCQRDSGTCSRNAIDFRNYHKYSGESVITFAK